MITADRLAYLTNLTALQITRIAQESGYSTDKFKTAKFLGITTGGQYVYSVEYSNYSEYDDGETHTTKVFLTDRYGENRVELDY